MTTATPIATRASDASRIEATALPEGFVLHPMQETHIGQAVSVISRAMNPDEGGYAAQTLHLHFASRKGGIDDGRSLYVLAQGSKIIGVVGLHHYAWGPPENVWLSWFALDPKYHGQGLAAPLLESVTVQAKQHHFMRFFIETYSTPEFDRARAFYRARGFSEVGGIPGWLPEGGSMVVLYKDLAPCA